MRLFTKLLKDRRHELDDRLSWIRWHVLENRDNLVLLQAAHALLRPGGGLPARLRHGLIEALFDYRPARWCRPDRCMSPPPWSQLNGEARQELRRIAALAQQRKLDQLDRPDQANGAPASAKKTQGTAVRRTRGER